MPKSNSRKQKRTGAERKRRRRRALRAVQHALEHPALKSFVDRYGGQVQELYERLSMETVEEGEATQLESAFSELGEVFNHSCDAATPIPEALRSAIWRHIATTAGHDPVKRLPDDYNEAVQLVSIEEHAQAWDSAPVPHVVLRIDLVNVVEQDLTDMIKALKSRQGLKTRRGTKASKDFRAILAGRAMARRVLSGERPPCIEASKWPDYCDSWMRYAETGRVDTYVAESVCLLYCHELCPQEQISEETVEDALRRRWRQWKGEGTGSLEELLGFRLTPPGYVREEGSRPIEPWVSAVRHNVFAPWW